MKTAIIIALAASCLASASARIWTSTDGKKIDAEFIAIENNKVVLNMKGREYRVPLDRLSTEDQTFANEQQTIADAPPTAAEGLQLAGLDIAAGELQELVIPLSEENQKIALKGGKGWRDKWSSAYTNKWMRKIEQGAESTKLRLLLGLPENFDPARKDWPIFIQWTSTDSQNNVGGGRKYWGPCKEQGWILISMDSEPDRKAGWCTSVFYANTLQVLEEMEKVWPQSRNWPIAVGGFSGGAKISQWMAPLTASIEDRDVKGVFMGGCNQANFWDYATTDLRAKKSDIRDFKVFVSTGKSDKLVPAASLARVEAACKKAGVRRLRSEHYSGGHSLSGQHVKDALAWFLSDED